MSRQLRSRSGVARADSSGSSSSSSASGRPSAVDTTVQSIQTTYDVRGMPVQVTSYSAQGAVVNDLERVYNAFGQLMTEYQEHSGAVNTSTSLNVQYQYAPGGSLNTTRPTAVIYPNGRVRNLNYGTSGGMDDALSRISSLVDSDGVTHLADYTRLGAASIVQVGYTRSRASTIRSSMAPAPIRILGSLASIELSIAAGTPRSAIPTSPGASMGIASLAIGSGGATLGRIANWSNSGKTTRELRGTCSRRRLRPLRRGRGPVQHTSSIVKYLEGSPRSEGSMRTFTCLLAGILASGFHEESESVSRRGTETAASETGDWLALRFARQAGGRAGLLVPPRAGPIDVDWAVSTGVFCRADDDLARELKRLRKRRVRFTGASALLPQVAHAFEDYDREPDAAPEPVRTTERVAPRSYREAGDLTLVKIRGQARSNAGVAFSSASDGAFTTDGALRSAFLVRDVSEVRIWRAQGVAVAIPSDGPALRFATYYSDDDLKSSGVARLGASETADGRGDWLAVRFRGQTSGVGGLLVPPCPGKQPDADWAFSVGIFCSDERDLLRETARIGLLHVTWRGAARAILHGGEIFEDYPVDLAAISERERRVGTSPDLRERVVPSTVVVFKLRGQHESTAGLGLAAWVSSRWNADSLCKGAVFVRDVREVQLWRAQGRIVGIMKTGVDSSMTTGYSDEELRRLNVGRGQ